MCIDAVTYSMVMRVLRSVTWIPEADEAADRLQIAAIDSARRDIEYNTDAPALCRPQAD